MAKIALLADSNAGITQEQAKELGIFIIPTPCLINGEVFLEGISLSQEQFYDYLAKDANVSTSQPAIGEIVELWDKLLTEYDEVVYIPISRGLSMSCETASAFASEAPYSGKVHVVDNMRVSVTQRQAILDALELAEKGKSGAEIKVILEREALQSSIYITVDTLKYLKKGGRVTPAGAAFGALLNIKPVLQIQGAKLDAFKKTRGMKAAKIAMLQAAKDDIANRFGGDISKIHVSVAYTYNVEEANNFYAEVKEMFAGAASFNMDPLSLSVSTHIGPGSLAIALSRKIEE